MYDNWKTFANSRANAKPGINVGLLIQRDHDSDHSVISFIKPDDEESYI